jgi:hypothetical protein
MRSAYAVECIEQDADQWRQRDSNPPASESTVDSEPFNH